MSVAPAVARHVNDSEEFSGRLEAIDFVELRSRVSGTIEKVHFADGASVRKGQVLFTVDPLPFEAELARAQSQLASAKARNELARSELVRANTLLSSQAVSQEEVDQLNSSSRTSLADIGSAESALRIARLNLGYTQVRAPIAGRASRAIITAGNLVNEQSVLTSIAGTERVYAYFDGSEETFLLLKSTAGTGNAPRVRMNLSNERDFPHEGRLDFVDNRLNPLTGAIRMRASFDNSKGQFTPGLAAKVRMESPVGYDAVMVPERAIGTDQSKKFVLVVAEDGRPQSRVVELGSLFGGMRVVRGGIKPGENIVVEGLQRVTPGRPVDPKVLKVDANGMPIIPAPPVPPGSAPAAKA